MKALLLMQTATAALTQALLDCHPGQVLHCSYCLCMHRINFDVQTHFCLLWLGVVKAALGNVSMLHIAGEDNASSAMPVLL